MVRALFFLFILITNLVFSLYDFFSGKMFSKVILYFLSDKLFFHQKSVSYFSYQYFFHVSVINLCNLNVFLFCFFLNTAFPFVLTGFLTVVFSLSNTPCWSVTLY